MIKRKKARRHPSRDFRYSVLKMRDVSRKVKSRERYVKLSIIRIEMITGV